MKAKALTLGREAFARISAVEGITLDAEMAEDFRVFDQEHVSAAARRQAIARKYGRAPA